MHHFRILLDLDGTVAQNAGRKMAERQFGITLTEQQAGRPLADILGMDRTAFWAWWHANQEEIYGQATALPGAAEVLRHIRQAGAFIAVVTARRSSAARVTSDWLKQHDVPHDLMVMDADDKVAIARELRLNLGFEDDPANALPLADLFPMALIENHKNQGQTLVHPQLERFTSWSDVLPWLHRLSARTA